MIGKAKRSEIAVATHAAREFIGDIGRRPSRSRNLIRFLEWAAATGFRGIDLSDSLIEFADMERVAELGRLAEERNLSIPTLNCLRASLCDERYSEDSVRRITTAVEAADHLGAEVVNVSLAVPRQRLDCNEYRGLSASPGSSSDASEADFELTIRRLDQLAGFADERGLALSIEMHHCSLADNSQSVLHILDGVARLNVGCNPDIVNMYWTYDEPEEHWLSSLKALAPRTNLWHVKNVRRIHGPDASSAYYVDAPLHSGDIDYRTAYDQMRKAGFSGWISIERAGPGDFLFTAAEGIAYLHDLMDEEKMEV